MANFLQIPVALRAPGTYVEFDSTRALGGLLNIPERALLIGPMTSSGTVSEGIAVRTNARLSDGQAGTGSFLSEMVKYFDDVNQSTELWMLPVLPGGGSIATIKSIKFGGTATASGSVYLYIAGRRYVVPVAKAATADQVATSATALVSADVTALVSAAVDGGDTTKVNFTAKCEGAIGDTIDVRVNYGDFDSTVAGITTLIATDVSGAGVPSLTTPLDNLGEEEFGYIGCAYRDTGSLTAMESFLADRESATVQKEGIGFFVASDTYGNLQTLGNSQNSQLYSILGVEENSPTPESLIAASYCGIGAFNLANDPARPLNTLELQGVSAVANSTRFTWSERNTLLYDGIATTRVVQGGKVVIDRAITTYQTNNQSVPDPAYLDITTVATLFYIRKQLRFSIGLTYPRHKIGPDAMVIRPGTAIVRPRDVKGLCIAVLRSMEQIGIVENVNQDTVFVERDPSDQTRINIVLSPDLVNGAHVFAAQVQFQL